MLSSGRLGVGGVSQSEYISVACDLQRCAIDLDTAIRVEHFFWCESGIWSYTERRDIEISLKHGGGGIIRGFVSTFQDERLVPSRGSRNVHYTRVGYYVDLELSQLVNNSLSYVCKRFESKG